MSTLATRIDRFVRWFFNVSPLTPSTDPAPLRRAAASPRRQARPASAGERRDARASRPTTAARPTDAEAA